jgi:hypothetical protein
MKHVVMILAAGLLLGAAVVPVVSKEQAAAFQAKLVRIVQHSESNSTKTLQTTVTEGEVNSYLRFSAGEQLPSGVTDPSVAIHGQGRISGRAVVDLDVIRKKGSGGWLDPTSYLTGRLPMTASGVLRTQDGIGRFELSTAEVAGIPIPKTFLQEIVSFYTRSADHPGGVTIDRPFELPANIRRIDVGEGNAVIVQ